jgi:hypothetical protein
MPDEAYTNQKELLTKIAQVTADKTVHWYDEGTDRMKSKRPSITLKMALNNYDWQGARINLTVTQKMLKDILRQLKNHEESFATEKVWAKNPHHEYTMWISEYSGDMSIHVNFKFDDNRFSDEGSDKWDGYIDTDGNKVRWDRD